MSKRIPKAKATNKNRIQGKKPEKIDNKIKFSFSQVNNNDYFGLDSTCDRWAADLFETMKKVSNIEIDRVMAGDYSGRNSTLRIHDHKNAGKLPCELPGNIDLKDMWQIRISKSKGGIHGVFYENIFFVVWFDPLHNLYPDENYGGLKKISKVESCCKERESCLRMLVDDNNRLKEENRELMCLLDEKTAP